jgi:hypothetical protein
VRLAAWDAHDEATAHRHLAFYPYAAPVQVDQLLHQRQTNAAAFVAPALGLFNAPKALKEQRQLGFWDARAGIGHRQYDRVPESLQRDLDAAIERELEGVRDQV